MENILIKKLWKSSGVIFQKDEDGFVELKPKAAIAAFIIIGIVFLIASGWAG